MKELEQEKDSLLAGLEVVERARDWYQGQIHNVTERQRQVGQSSHCTVSPPGGPGKGVASVLPVQKGVRMKVGLKRGGSFCCRSPTRMFKARFMEADCRQRGARTLVSPLRPQNDPFSQSRIPTLPPPPAGFLHGGQSESHERPHPQTAGGQPLPQRPHYLQWGGECCAAGLTSVRLRLKCDPLST